MGWRGIGRWLALGCALSGCGMPFADGPRMYGGPIRSWDIERGEYVFTYTCAACHDGRVNPNGYQWEPWRMRRQVREGNRVMPPLERSLVSDEDLEAVLAYLTTIGAVSGEPLPPPLETGPELGEEEGGHGLTVPEPTPLP